MSKRFKRVLSTFTVLSMFMFAFFSTSFQRIGAEESSVKEDRIKVDSNFNPRSIEIQGFENHEYNLYLKSESSNTKLNVDHKGNVDMQDVFIQPQGLYKLSLLNTDGEILKEEDVILRSRSIIIEQGREVNPVIVYVDKDYAPDQLKWYIYMMKREMN